MTLLKDVFTHFANANTTQKGAALAYYTVFSFLPMIMVLVAILGMLFGAQAVSGELFGKLQGLLGEAGARQVETLIKQQHTQHSNLLTSIIGFATLMLSASGMFNQLHGAFNGIWQLKAKPRSSLLRYLFNHLSALSILILVGFVLLVSTSVSSFLAHHGPQLNDSLTHAHILEHLISAFVVSVLFCLVFRTFGDAIVPWKTAAVAGVVTALLFMFGKIAIGMYIGHSKLTSTFGAASMVALILVWVYYTSQILFLGASFAYVYGKRSRQPILPNADAVAIKTEEVDR